VQCFGEESRECSSCGTITGRILRTLNGSIVETADERGFETEAVVQAVLSAQALNETERSRRDEDMKRALTEDAVGREATSRTGGVKPFAILNANLVRANEHKYLVKYQKCLERLGVDFSGFLNVAEDGARFGQPQEEEEIYGFGMMDQKLWGVLRPQDICVSTR
jgi:hypothetical protein